MDNNMNDNSNQNIYGYINDLDMLIENAKTSVFSNGNVQVSRDEVLAIIESMRLNIPSEIKQAQRIINNTSKIINEANSNADLIIKEAKDIADKMVMQHEITLQAKEEGNAIIYDAMETAKAYKRGALEYADDILKRAEDEFKGIIDEFRACYEQCMKRADEVNAYLEGQCDELYRNRMDLKSINNEVDNLEPISQQNMPVDMQMEDEQ